MEEYVYNVETKIIGEADGSKTYEIRKRYDFEGSTARQIFWEEKR